MFEPFRRDVRACTARGVEYLETGHELRRNQMKVSSEVSFASLKADSFAWLETCLPAALNVQNKK
jgi:hypothetical protein